MCFQEWIVEDAGKSAKIRGNFQMLISQAKRPERSDRLSLRLVTP